MKPLPHEKKFWSKFKTHSPHQCEGQFCPVHNPSNHKMRKWKLHFRDDIGITERICKHGIGHNDPDCPAAKGHCFAACSKCFK